MLGVLATWIAAELTAIEWDQEVPKPVLPISVSLQCVPPGGHAMANPVNVPLLEYLLPEPSEVPP